MSPVAGGTPETKVKVVLIRPANDAAALELSSWGDFVLKLREEWDKNYDLLLQIAEAGASVPSQEPASQE